MKIKQIIDEDFINYKRASMIVGFSKCSFKCDKECGKQVCQNGVLANSKDIDVSYKYIVKRYMENDLTSAIVFAGLEPFDTWNDVYKLIGEFRKYTEDDIVIFTGYYKDEIQDFVLRLKKYKNIVIKFGRYIPNSQRHYDDIIGVELASKNQYAERIS